MYNAEVNNNMCALTTCTTPTPSKMEPWNSGINTRSDEEMLHWEENWKEVKAWKKIVAFVVA